MLLHVGSGIATIGLRDDAALAKLIPLNARYVGVGVGKQWGRAFMKQAADRTGGYFTQINPDEAINWRAFDLLATLNTPRMLQVSVADKDGRVSFLTEAAMLSQGEEICAVGRIDLAKKNEFPKTLIVKGKLGDKDFVKEIAIVDGRDGAGYLPRQWAKLEIDRLLAEDADKNKDAIIALSKQSYVMTPFTSLLVLETEADYEKFKVDRGRKDHWAMYGCPERIAVVQEWGNRAAASAAKDACDPREVMATILVRVPPRIMQSSSPPQYQTNWVTAVSADVLYAGAAAFPFGNRTVEENDKGFLDDGNKWQFGMDTKGPRPGESAQTLSRALQKMYLPAFDNRLQVVPLIPQDMIGRQVDVKIGPGGSKGSFGRVDGGINGTPGSIDRVGGGFFGIGRNPFEAMGGFSGGTAGYTATDLKSIRSSIVFGSGGIGTSGVNSGLAFGVDRPDLRRDEIKPGQRLANFNPLEILELEKAFKLGTRRVLGQPILKSIPIPTGNAGEVARILGGVYRDSPTVRITAAGNKILVYASPSEQTDIAAYFRELVAPSQAILYVPPTFTAHARIFDDLLWYAPGMNTSMADVAAVLEAETKVNPEAKQGTIDPAARRLIDKARASGWRQLTVDAIGRQPAFDVYFNGEGHFAIDRLLECGLREQVICDGKILWHIYPEIGLGAKRAVSRFHREDLLAIVPWLVASAEDLAQGCDVRLVENGVVGILPQGADKARDEDGKPRQYLQLNLVFDADGRLAERQVMVMPEKKTIARWRYGDDGAITVVDPANHKTVEQLKLKVSEARAPNLNPALKDIVVVPMPLRSPAYLESKLSGEMADYDEDLAISRLASACATLDPVYGEILHLTRFHNKGDNRIGLAVLLASAGSKTIWPQNSPRTPLAIYLTSRFEKGEISNIGGPLEGFTQRLNRFRAVWNEADARKRLQTLQGIVKSPAPLAVFDWALVARMCRAGVSADATLQDALIDASKVFKDDPGLSYAARFEVAHAIFKSGNTTAGRELYRELYLDSLGTRILPPIDKGFRDALAAPGDKGPTYADLMRQAATMLVKHDHRSELFGLAWQNAALGDLGMANEILAKAVAVCEPTAERDLARLAALQLYRQTGQAVEADRMLQLLLAQEPYKSDPALWRVAAEMAAQRKQSARVALCMEQTLELSFRNLPPVVNLQAIRNDYTTLLTYYQQMADAFALLEKEPTRDFMAKVIRAADRWRSLEPDPTQPCQMAAKILQTVGATELAWDYLTTPIGMKPNEAKPWWDLAKALAADGSLTLADRAFAQAFEAEPTNAQILWERAASLEQAGRRAEARSVYQKLAEGQWQERFRWMQNEAKQKNQ